MPTRSATAVWTGGFKDGKGQFTGTKGLSGSYTAASRFESPGGDGLNPEDLLAAAEASCYSMALSVALERNGTPPNTIETTAHCTVERVNGAQKITTMKIETRADVPNIDEATFQKIAEATRDGCPVSKALIGNVDLQIDAKLGR
jgi:osmotically inducible protein OsmC